MATTRPAVPDTWAAPILSGAALARERLLPVVDALAPLLPDGGLVRGQAVSTTGPAAMSLALATVTGAVAAGSWLAVVDVPMLGLETADEFGLPLERIVRVDPGLPGATGAERAQSWAELMTAAVDGFDVAVTRIPPRLGRALATRVQARWKARGAVVVVVGRPAPVSTAIELETSEARWEGIEPGAGHLQSRRAVVVAGGRRIPRPRRAELFLPGPDGAVVPAGDAVVDSPAAPRWDELAG